MNSYNARLSALVERVCEEKLDPIALEDLIVKYLIHPGEPNARQLAAALTTVVPYGEKGLAARLDRFGERWAYGAIRFAMPGHLEAPGEYRIIRRMSRLATRLEIVLLMSNQTGHLIAVQSFRDRLGTLEVSVHAFRDLMKESGPSRPLSGVLVERITLCALDAVSLFPRLAARLIASAGRRGGELLRRRVRQTVPVALEHPYDPVLNAEAMRRRQDLLLDEQIPRATSAELVRLVRELELSTDVLVTDEDAPPSFLGALTRNTHFRSAAVGLGGVLERVSRN